MQKMKHLEVEVSHLKHFERNPRKHSDAQIDEICKNINKFGLYQELVCDENLNVLVGNARLDAAIKMNIPKVRVCIIEGLSEKDKKKIVLADNKIFQMGEIEFGIEKELLQEIGDIDIPGYNEEYLKIMLDCNNNEEEITRIQKEETPNTKKDAPPEIINIVCPHCGKEIAL